MQCKGFGGHIDLRCHRETWLSFFRKRTFDHLPHWWVLQPALLLDRMRPRNCQRTGSVIERSLLVWLALQVRWLQSSLPMSQTRNLRYRISSSRRLRVVLRLSESDWHELLLGRGWLLRIPAAADK